MDYRLSSQERALFAEQTCLPTLFGYCFPIRIKSFLIFAREELLLPLSAKLPLFLKFLYVDGTHYSIHLYLDHLVFCELFVRVMVKLLILPQLTYFAISQFGLPSLLG